MITTWARGAAANTAVRAEAMIIKRRPADSPHPKITIWARGTATDAAKRAEAMIIKAEPFPR
ncbi:hypothetical protein [Pseudonocardia pini]|uniref:hypothetical protein n=1 Tax=Pseudonocardia pini TaxID=2758030 RepID=UPI0015F07461|nr:hypothetical protein [Pseudonocardia pini]